ncbi:recombinase family protein [Paenarthrobacter sp. YJN-5]|uniref:recombinase family protein n=1 Tax=Paenarthrobacter sp. YJN-5 TaxID=2735316 RepID=UPI001878929E|nr:recombinase family protein [Paenarthrobacter sp. YJN-5]QOT16515.1 recombinase family protein [Paenarthrobacter sp. YJN-5]
MPRANLKAVPDSPQRAVAYIRVSKERDGMISPELQLAAIEQHCERSGYEIVETISDLDMTGRFWKRRQVERAIGIIEAGTADVLVVWKVSRVSRNRLDWAIAVDRVEGIGGRLESATEPMDTSTSSGRFARGMLAELAAFESERMGEQWKEAHARRVKTGVPANGKPRFGYQYTKETGFTPDPVTGPVLAELYRRYIAGQSVYALVKWLNDGPTRPVTGYGVSSDGLWSDRTVRRILDQGFGAGYITHHGERVPGIHEPIITEDEWTEYQARRSARRVYRRSERSTYLFSGMIRCECGAAMHAGLFGAGRAPKYKCAAVSSKRKHDGGYVMTSTVEKDFLAWLESVAADIDSEAEHAVQAQQQAAKATDKVAHLKTQLVKLGTRLDQLTNKMLDGTIPDDTYRRLRDEIEAQRGDIETSMRDAQVVATRPPSSLVPELLENWTILPMDTKRDLVSRLIHRVVVKPGRPRAHVTVVPRW